MLINTQKVVSKLDLKFLDLKFLSIPPSTHNLSSFTANQSKTKDVSCLCSESDEETILKYDLSSNVSVSPHLFDSKKSQRTHDCKTFNSSILKNKKNLELEAQIEKYKNKIEKVKEQNQLIHSEIAQIYHDKDHQEKNSQVKRVKNLEIYHDPVLSSQNLLSSNSKFKSKSKDVKKENIKSENFYDLIGANSSPVYKEELDKLK